MEDENRIDFIIERVHLHACWKAVKRVIENDIPETPSDEALLMELLSDIARQDKETKKEFKLKLKKKQIVPLWHCLNIILQNKIYESHTEVPVISQIIASIAIEADKDAMMNTKPKLELV